MKTNYEFRECNVVLIENQQHIDIYVNPSTRMAYYCNGERTQQDLKELGFKGYTMYIISDNAMPRDNDPCICMGDNDDYELTTDTQKINGPTLQKVIATNDVCCMTDATISDAFMREFVVQMSELNIIKKVLVLFKTNWDRETIDTMIGYGDSPDDYPYKENIHLDKDGNLITKPVRNNIPNEEISKQITTKEGNNHLEFIYNRLISQHDEDPNRDYMIKLNSIINWTKLNL